MIKEQLTFFKELSNDLIQFLAFHEEEETIINFLLKNGYTPQQLIEYGLFKENKIDEVIQKLIEDTIKETFDL